VQPCKLRSRDVGSRSKHWCAALAVLQNNTRTCHLCFHLGPSSPLNHSPILEQNRSFPNRGQSGVLCGSAAAPFPSRDGVLHRTGVIARQCGRRECHDDDAPGSARPWQRRLHRPQPHEPSHARHGEQRRHLRPALHATPLRAPHALLVAGLLHHRRAVLAGAVAGEGEDDEDDHHPLWLTAGDHHDHIAVWDARARAVLHWLNLDETRGVTLVSVGGVQDLCCAKGHRSHDWGMIGSVLGLGNGSEGRDLNENINGKCGRCFVKRPGAARQWLDLDPTTLDRCLHGCTKSPIAPNMLPMSSYAFSALYLVIL
jgi:hypothetical protein